MDIDTSALFAPIVINGHTVKNRLSVAPMTRITATEDGRATETMTRYYERFARGGFGAVITEGIYTDQAFSQGYVHQPGMTDEVQANAWKPVVSGIKAHGALAIAQLMHAGAISQSNRFRDTTVGPSAIQPKGEQMAFYHGKGRYAVPAAISDEQIADVVTGFAESAARAIEIAGFDAIEIHGANGYLLDQFLTDYANTRSDRWGGTTQNRVRLILETLKAVREKVGAEVPVGVRGHDTARSGRGRLKAAVFVSFRRRLRRPHRSRARARLHLSPAYQLACRNSSCLDNQHLGIRRPSERSTRSSANKPTDLRHGHLLVYLYFLCSRRTCRSPTDLLGFVQS